MLREQYLYFQFQCAKWVGRLFDMKVKVVCTWRAVQRVLREQGQIHFQCAKYKYKWVGETALQHDVEGDQWTGLVKEVPGELCKEC